MKNSIIVPLLIFHNEFMENMPIIYNIVTSKFNSISEVINKMVKYSLNKYQFKKYIDDINEIKI